MGNSFRRTALYFVVVASVLGYALSVRGQSGPTENATIYVFMPDAMKSFRRIAAPIYLDDKKVVQLGLTRYFALRVPPGKHSLYAKDKKFGGIDLDVTGGVTYYVKISAGGEGGKTRIHSVSIVPKEEGEFAVRNFKPVKVVDIHDSTFVDMKVVSPK